MNPRIIFAALAISALAASPLAAKKQKDPTVMTINHKDVKLSEFSWLYNKNRAQQLNPQSLDEYIDMFVLYKLKVADAEAAGLDTLASFRQEYAQYLDELSTPYFTDSLVVERLTNEAYSHMQTSRKVSHIMVPYSKSYAQRKADRARLDSIRREIVDNGASFELMAVKHSSDRSADFNQGSMGYISATQYPYPFEAAAYSTPVGQVSEVFEDAPYGYHIVKVYDEKTGPFQVEARHILVKFDENETPEGRDAKKAKIDSIHSLLKGGADFAQLARETSDDPGSGANGGSLGRFGRGRMVKQFEEQAFALAEGEISEPFETQFGYHIVQTTRHLSVQPLAMIKENIQAQFKRDFRSDLPRKEKLQALGAQYGASIDRAKADQILDLLAATTLEDRSDVITPLMASAEPIATVGSTSITVGQVFEGINPMIMTDANSDPASMFENALDKTFQQGIMAEARTRLASEDPDFSNLMQEYRDGILLFDISNRRVWDRASTDTEGLKAYFESHRGDYNWDKPHFKGQIVAATSDSIASEVAAFLDQNSYADNDALVNALKDRFGRNVKLENVVIAKGDNAVVDYLAFEGERPAPVGRWAAWVTHNSKVIYAPEDFSDVKGLVSTDYQQLLEQDWTSELRSKYPVKINNKLIRKTFE